MTILSIYRQSKKKRDNFWTEWVSRPPAAILVWLLKDTKITPNQVSFLAIVVALLGCAVMVWWRAWAGLIVSGLTLQLAYIIDCADGQLARLTGRTSPVGALLDFMLDEVKALAVIVASAARLWWMGHDEKWLLIGMGGLLVAATGITLTTFMRRAEYLEAVGAQPVKDATERAEIMPERLTPLSVVEAAGRFVLHYPSWFLIACAFDRLDVFLYAYLGAHVAYLGRSSLILLIRLGRRAT